MTIEEKTEKFANDTTLETGNNHFRRKQAYIAGYKEAEEDIIKFAEWIHKNTDISVYSEENSRLEYLYGENNWCPIEKLYKLYKEQKK